MTTINTYAEKVAQLLANETTSVDWHIAAGTGTSTPNINDTSLTEIGREAASFSYSDETGTWSSVITSVDSDFMASTATEIGVYDASSSGNLMTRDLLDDPITFTSDKRVKFEVDVSFNDSSNTTRAIVTDKMWENIYELMSGEDSTYPTHVAFSTHLILDTFNATTGWSATNGDVATSTNRQEGTNSVSLSKTDTGSTSVYMTKTLGAAVDFSDATTVRLWTRIGGSATLAKIASSDGMIIRIGSDSSNYKQIQLDRSDLDTVWKLQELAIGDFTSTGSPDMENVDYLYIGLTSTTNADTWTADEVLFDMLSGQWALSETNNTLHEEVVRKAISTVELDAATVRYSGLLSTSEGNTYNYYYVGLFDDASAGDMYLVNQLYLTEKNANKQINFFVELGVRVV